MPPVAASGNPTNGSPSMSDEPVINPVTGQRAATDSKDGGLTRMMVNKFDQSLSWADLAGIRSLTDLQIVLKGITTAAAAKLAMQCKVDAILLSKLGGRKLGYAPPFILLLL